MKQAIVKLLLCAVLSLPFAMPQQLHAEQQREQQQVSAIPMLSSLKQISANQLLVTYDQPVDVAKGKNPTNYWVQSTTDDMPTGIATLGKNDTVNNNNSLTADKVTIQQQGNSGQSFVMTFKQNITRGKSYKLIICYVTKPGAPPYSGDNGSAVFVGR